MVINGKPRAMNEATNEVGPFDQKQSKSMSSKSSFHTMEEMRRNNLKKQSRLYSSIDNSYLKHCNKTGHTNMQYRVSRKRKASGKLRKSSDCECIFF